MELPLKKTADGLVIEIPDDLLEKVAPLLAKLNDLSSSSSVILSDTAVAELRDRADKAEVELNDLRDMVQTLTREQWVYLGEKLGFLTAPADKDIAALGDAAAHAGEYYLPEFKLWLKPSPPKTEVKNA